MEKMNHYKNSGMRDPFPYFTWAELSWHQFMTMQKQNFQY